MQCTLSKLCLEIKRVPNMFKGERNPNIKYVSQQRISQTMNFDTSLIKIGQEITTL